MELVNKPFTMQEYEIEQSNKLLLQITERDDTHLTRPMEAYWSLRELTIRLIHKLYGNNNS